MTVNVMNGFYKFSDCLLKLSVTNILWILFSLMGIVIFGFFPATIAMFTVVRKIMLKEDVAVLRTFWKVYKTEFWKSNLLGLILVIIGYIFYIDLNYLKHSTNVIQFLYAPLLIMNFIYGLSLLYIFPVYAEYKLRIPMLIKNAFLLMVLYPIFTISMILFCIIFYHIMIIVPSLIIFFSGSVTSYILMKFANLAFQKNSQKLNQNIAKEISDIK